MSNRSRSNSPVQQVWTAPETFQFGSQVMFFPSTKYPNPLQPLQGQIDVNRLNERLEITGLKTSHDHPEGDFEVAGNPRAIHHASNLMKRLKHAVALGCIGLSNSDECPC